MGVYKICHFACERAIYVLFVWKCLIRMTSSLLTQIVWLEICVIHMISKHIKISLSHKRPRAILFDHERRHESWLMTTQFMITLLWVKNDHPFEKIVLRVVPSLILVKTTLKIITIQNLPCRRFFLKFSISISNVLFAFFNFSLIGQKNFVKFFLFQILWDFSAKKFQ